MAAVVVGFLAALIVAEATFRVAGLGGERKTKCQLRRVGDDSLYFSCYPSNAGGKFRPLPTLPPGEWRLQRLLSPPVDLPLDALKDTPWCVEYRCGSTDVRGPAVSDVPAAGILRIAAIGDSFTLGEGVPEDESLPAQLGRLLGPGVEVLNLGESGADTNLEMARLDYFVPRYRPAQALVIFNVNDVGLAPDIARRMGDAYDMVNLRAEQLDVGGAALRASRVVRFFATALETRRVARETVSCYLDAYDPAKNGAALDALAAQFRRMATMPGCAVSLVVYPMMYGLSSAYPLQPCHDRVVELARRAGLPVLDLAPAFAGQDAVALRVDALDHHPNGRAHAIAANAVAAWLRSAQPR